MDKKAWPSIGEYRYFNREEATAFLFDIIKNRSIVEWIIGEVGYDPTPKMYVEDEYDMAPSITQKISLGQLLGVVAPWEHLEKKGKEIEDIIEKRKPYNKKRTEKNKELRALKEMTTPTGELRDKINQLAKEVDGLKEIIAQLTFAIRNAEAEFDKEWEHILTLQTADPRFSFGDMIPATRHEIFVLCRILGRTAGYCGNVGIEPPKHDDTSSLLSWMCRSHESTEFWKDSAKLTFARQVRNYDTGDLSLWGNTMKANINQISEASLKELSVDIREKLTALPLKEDTVKTWDFFFERQIDKVVPAPKITDMIDWEGIADYFLLSASVSIDKNTNDKAFSVNESKTIRYKPKTFLT